MKISEALHCAADQFLSVDGINRPPYTTFRYSCDTLHNAIRKTYPGPTSEERLELRDRIKDGMRELGLDPESMIAFQDIPEGVERQAARYNWLKFCALLAEEQGE